MLAGVSIVVEVGRMGLEVVGFCRNERMEKFVNERERMVHEVVLGNKTRFKIIIIDP